MRKALLILSVVLGVITIITVGLLGIVYLKNRGIYNVLQTTEFDKSLPYLEVEGYKFHGEIHGNHKKPLVVVLHGGPGGDYRYLLPLKDLSEDYNVLFFDQRGSGLSPRVDKEELSLKQYIKDLDNIINKYNNGNDVYLLGHSWGAMYASIYIGKYPDKISKAVLAEPGFLDNHFRKIFDNKTGLADLKPDSTMLRSMISAFGKSLHLKDIKYQDRNDFFLDTFMTTPIENHPLAGYYVDNKMENASGPIWRGGSLVAKIIPQDGILPDGTFMDLTKGVDKWKGEALFISGSENSIIGPDFQIEQMKKFPSASLVIIEGAGHTMFGEKPEESIAIIKDFF